MTSIKDVAALAGVSVGTVSKVLNHPDTVRASTRAHVAQVIADLGFVPNGSARQLKAGRSSIVAFLAIDTANPFFADVARGVEEEIRRRGLSLFLCNSDQSAERESEYLANLTELRVRGVLITAINLDNPRIRQIRDSGSAVVIVDRVLDADALDWCAVGVDDVAGGDLAVEHLIERGHRRFAYIGGPRELRQVADRLRGAELAVERAGLDPASLTVLQTNGLDVAEGRRAGERLLGVASIRRPTAAFCANDLVAVGLLQHLTMHGVRVPDDVAIVGYDDIHWAAASAVPLTSVAQPRHLLGRTAAQLLLGEADGDGSHEHRQVVFTPELIARESTASRGTRSNDHAVGP